MREAEAAVSGCRKALRPRRNAVEAFVGGRVLGGVPEARARCGAQQAGGGRAARIPSRASLCTMRRTRRSSRRSRAYPSLRTPTRWNCGPYCSSVYTPSRISMCRWMLRFSALSKRWIRVTTPVRAPKAAVSPARRVRSVWMARTMTARQRAHDLRMHRAGVLRAGGRRLVGGEIRLQVAGGVRDELAAATGREESVFLPGMDGVMRGIGGHRHPAHRIDRGLAFAVLQGMRRHQRTLSGGMDSIAC